MVSHEDRLVYAISRLRQAYRLLTGIQTPKRLAPPQPGFFSSAEDGKDSSLYCRVDAPNLTTSPSCSCRGALGRIHAPFTFVRCAAKRHTH